MKPRPRPRRNPFDIYGDIYENPRKKSTKVQTVMFHRDYWTLREAKAWIRSHGYKLTHRGLGGKDRASANYYRFRQFDTSRFVRGSFRTIRFGADTGIKAVVGRPK